MRLPGDVNDPNDRAHFLTDSYIDKFKLKIKKFSNVDENGLSNIYGLKAKTNGMCFLKCFQLLKSNEILSPSFKQEIAKTV